MDRAIDIVLAAFLLLCGIVLQAAGLVDTFLAALMGKAGIDPHAQTLILIAVALLLVVGLVRRLGGLFSLLITILLILLLLRWAMPGLHMPPAPAFGGWPGSNLRI